MEEAQNNHFMSSRLQNNLKKNNLEELNESLLKYEYVLLSRQNIFKQYLITYTRHKLYTSPISVKAIILLNYIIVYIIQYISSI